MSPLATVQQQLRQLGSQLFEYVSVAPATADESAILRRLRCWRRIGWLSLPGLALIVSLVRLALAPPNLALHCPVRGTSAALNTTLQAVVDGNRYGQLGFHSQQIQHPWLELDLGKAQTVGSVSVFGRSDCCEDQSLPLRLELSEDGKTYRELAELSTPFTPFEPWVVRVSPPRRARFVRVTTVKMGLLVLAEVEVYPR